jgi:AhpD family alkylhydroperoxidase
MEMLDKAEIEKIEKIYKDVTYVHESFTVRGSKTYESFLKFNNDAMKEGSIPKMYKELIALGTASFHNCEPCIALHIKRALKSGATDKQIVEVVEVASEMGGGPVVARSSFVFKVLEYLKDKDK